MPHDDLVYKMLNTNSDSELKYYVEDVMKELNDIHVRYNTSTTNGGFWDTVYTTVSYTNGMGYTINYHTKTILQVENAIKIFVPIIEDKMEEYISTEFDKYYIVDMGHYIYQIIQEKAYDIASEVVESEKEEYCYTPDEETIIDAIIDNIDFESLYELMDDILNAPSTMEEKLAEVGMSYADFL